MHLCWVTDNTKLVYMKNLEYSKIEFISNKFGLVSYTNVHHRGNYINNTIPVHKQTKLAQFSCVGIANITILPYN